MERKHKLTDYNHNPNVGFLHYIEGSKSCKDDNIIDRSNANVGYFRHSPISMPSSFLTALVTDSHIRYPGILLRNISLFEEPNCDSSVASERSIDNDEYLVLEGCSEERTGGDSNTWEIVETKRKSDSTNSSNETIDAG